MNTAPGVVLTRQDKNMLQRPIRRRRLFTFILTALCISSCNESAQIAPGEPVVNGSRNLVATSAEQARERDEDARPNIIVVFTDDQGYADLGAQGILSDIDTPHLDQLADDGVRMTAGYVTAPQCIPSRAGLLTGEYQQKFGLDDNRFTPMPLQQITVADRLQDAGYHTGMVGKWHLDFNPTSPGIDYDTLTLAEKTPYFPDQRGFDDVYFGYRNTWWTNYDLQGNTLSAAYRENKDYRLDVATDAGIAFIDKHEDEPFFLYLAYFAPHVPLESTPEYLSRFSGVPQTRRQHALAMLSAVDDGVGRIRDRLAESQLSDNTLIFFISDNGAPLGIHKLDLPIDNNAGAWDGSLNEPMIGEKGMLSEGGIRVPYIVSWPGTVPAGVVLDTPVTTLDVATTGLAAAGQVLPAELDGENLLPLLTGEEVLEERPLYWRFWGQSAVRQGQWKYLQAGAGYEFLFDMDSATPEAENLLDDFPEVAASLRRQLIDWTDNLHRPGLSDPELNVQEEGWYGHYFPIN